ncbi:MarR family winged helix-turn-helix transcriptional regulator [Spirochaeta cellobiosiphila]|uniref:MarR family winged helix-turn-helix transcriptional regulator n=1 Tax=Spirochaeta cellobiosiphila TaxID=504483 RepID=UPI000423F3F4|nr:MarR family transcriptional regulator [Spirochaeta cellobiosiphila]
MEYDEGSLLLENQLCFALYTASKEIIRSYRPYLGELDLTYTQYLAMLVLWEESPLSSKVMGNKLLLDSGTLTPLLKKLETKGFISRKVDSHDERQLIVTLTEEGAKLKSKAKTIPHNMFCKLHRSQKEIIDLRTQLKRLTDDLLNSN